MFIYITFYIYIKASTINLFSNGNNIYTFPKFMKKSDFYNENNGLFEDDTIIYGVYIRVYKKDIRGLYYYLKY